MRMPDAVALVPQIGDAFDLAVAHQIGNAFDQAALVHLIRQLGDDDAALAALGFFDERLGLNDDAPAPGGIRRANGIAAFHRFVVAEHHAARGKVRPFDELHQIVHADPIELVPAVDQIRDRFAHLAQVVRRDVGRHADGNAGRAVDEQVGNGRRAARAVL